MNQAIKDKIEREATAQADDYVEQGWFRLEYSSFGTTAKEVKQSLHTGHVTGATKWAEVALKLREALLTTKLIVTNLFVNRKNQFCPF